ncbi:MAG: sialidase family protein [Candidatus Bathyarchaeia archaeon]|nr:exo-alpha-sialidase [Candidatus Bathyarchaeota archaeon]
MCSLAGEVFDLIVCPANSRNPRNTEADIIELTDGRLLLAYTEFYHYESHDMAPARIAGKISYDRGRSWSDPFTIQENIGCNNVMEADLLRLRTGEIALFFLIKNSESDCHPYMKKTFDEAGTWSELVPIAKFYQGYFTTNNDRAIQLSNGRILLPVAYTPNIWAMRKLTSFCFYSDDNGRTWFKSDVEVSLQKATAEEPGVIELKDGRLMMWFRTTLGYIYRAFSDDFGETWGKAEPMPLSSPNSPQAMKRIPKTNDILLVWNNTPGPQRVPLTTAISRDEGETWENIKDIEADPRFSYAYPSITFVRDEALITYYCHDRKTNLLSLKLKIFPIDWFYE